MLIYESDFGEFTQFSFPMPIKACPNKQTKIIKQPTISQYSVPEKLLFKKFRNILLPKKYYFNNLVTFRSYTKGSFV